MMKLPAEFVQTVSTTFDDGKAWLAGLPDLLDVCARRFLVTIGEPYPLSYNFVARANGANADHYVLKVGVPNPELTTEIDALRLYAGQGVARLVDYAPELGALLLERLDPGMTLATLADDRTATEIAAVLMKRLWRPMTGEHSFHTVAEWGQRAMQELRAEFDGGVGPFNTVLIQYAEETFAATAASPDQRLLHGDLHHENVLSAQREPWLVIDPKGVVGPPGYECGTYLRNYLVNQFNPAQVNARRVDQFASILELPRDEVLRWGIAHNMLSAWWSYEDQAVLGNDALRCAELCARELGVL